MNNHIQKIRDSMTKAEKIIVEDPDIGGILAGMYFDMDDIRILLAEIDRLTSTCVECEDCILQAGEISQ